MNVCIIGCGWLGKPLALALISQGVRVAGSVRQIEQLSELEAAGISAFAYDGALFPEIPVEHANCDWMILCFPPSKSANYTEQLQQLVAQTSKQTNLLFTSTTGVYVNKGRVNEQAEVLDEHPVYLAEQVIRSSGKNSVILRLAGLIGGERHPIKQLAGRTLENGQDPVNLITRKDVIAAISCILQSGIHNELFNLCYPDHPTRAEYYVEQAKLRSLPAPIFTFDTTRGKEINGSYIEKVLNFTYTEPISS